MSDIIKEEYKTKYHRIEVSFSKCPVEKMWEVQLDYYTIDTNEFINSNVIFCYEIDIMVDIINKLETLNNHG